LPEGVPLLLEPAEVPAPVGLEAAPPLLEVGVAPLAPPLVFWVVPTVGTPVGG